MSIKHFIIIVYIILLSSCAHRFEVQVPNKQPPAPKIENVKVALVLGGGGAKAIVQLGAI